MVPSVGDRNTRSVCAGGIMIDRAAGYLDTEHTYMGT